MTPEAAPSSPTRPARQSTTASPTPMTHAVPAILLAALTSASLAPATLAQLTAERISPTATRFFTSPAHAANPMPSVALESPVPSLGSTPSVSITPTFFFDNGLHAVVIDTPEGTSFYGTGMVSGPLKRNGRFVTNYNDDSYGYSDGDQQLYQSHPWVLAVRPDGTAFGVWADTTYRSSTNLTRSDFAGPGPDIRFDAEGPEFAVYIIENDSPQAVLTELANLTGHPPLPPVWSLGYHQSRYSYTPQSRALDIAQEFRNRDLPIDAIWLDIDYMDGFRVFTFDPLTFPNPAALNTSLDNIDVNAIWMINPGVKFDPGYTIYDQGEALDVWVNTADGTTDFVGEVWPGLTKWPDFTNQSVRTWWASLYAPFISLGVDGVWNDMNEPTVFNAPGMTMPDDNQHNADPELGGPGPHVRYHNIYGMQMIRATRQGVLDANPTKRPFVLTRANFLGGHRYAACWTGDNVANEYHLDVSIPMTLNLGLSGQPFAGPDIGGFVGDGNTDLFERWMGVGALLPFARGHTANNTRDKEPWTWGTEAEQTSRLALNRRYRLLPHIYTAFYQAHTTGLPVARPLFFAQPDNTTLHAEDNAFILGDGLIVSTAGSVNTACGPLNANFPTPTNATIYPFGFPQTNDPAAPSDTTNTKLPDLYLIGGHILPTQPIVQSTANWPADELTLIIALDDTGYATGTLYEDAGDGWNHLTGDFLLTQYEAFTNNNTVTVTTASSQGSMPRPSRTLNIRLLLPDGSELNANGTDGSPVNIPLPNPAGRNIANPRNAPATDGCNILNDFAPANGGITLASQTTTPVGTDNDLELNQLLARQDTSENRLELAITGNLASSFAVAIFIDTNPGGQNTIDLSTLTSPPSGLPPLNNLAFDPGFEPDTLLFINRFNEQFWLDQVQLPTDAPGIKTFRGTSFLEAANGQLSSGNNPNDIRLAITDFNTAGVTPNDASNPASANAGIELSLPLADLGLNTLTGPREIKIAAVAVDANGALTNQMLPPLPQGPAGFGVAPDLAFIQGQQFTSFILPGPADINQDDRLSTDDLYDWHANPTDLTGDNTADDTDRRTLQSAIRFDEPADTDR